VKEISVFMQGDIIRALRQMAEFAKSSERKRRYNRIADKIEKREIILMDKGQP
jgi:hypothetical protein